MFTKLAIKFHLLASLNTQCQKRFSSSDVSELVKLRATATHDHKHLNKNTHNEQWTVKRSRSSLGFCKQAL